MRVSSDSDLPPPDSRRCEARGDCDVAHMFGTHGGGYCHSYGTGETPSMIPGVSPVIRKLINHFFKSFI